MGSDDFDTGENKYSNLLIKWALISRLAGLSLLLCLAVSVTAIAQSSWKTEQIKIALIAVYFLFFMLLLVAKAFILYYGHYRLRRKFNLTTATPGELKKQCLRAVLVPEFAIFPLIILLTSIRGLGWYLELPVSVIFFVWVWHMFRRTRKTVAGLQVREVEDDSHLMSLREFAAANGINSLQFRLLESPGNNESVVVYRSSAGKPTFYFSQPTLNLLNNDELKCVFAHELAHHKQKDTLKSFGINMVFAAVVIAVIAAIYMHRLPYTTSFIDMAVIIPYIMLAWTVLGYLFIKPLELFLSRRQETQANAWALRATGNPAAFISAMKKLAANNKKTGRPSLLQKALFATHPPLDDVIRQGLDFAAAHNIQLSETSQGDFC